MPGAMKAVALAAVVLAATALQAHAVTTSNDRPQTTIPLDLNYTPQSPDLPLDSGVLVRGPSVH